MTLEKVGIDDRGSDRGRMNSFEGQRSGERMENQQILE